MAKDVYISLISRTTDGTDEYGEPIYTEKSRRTPAQTDGVRRNEFYQAAAAGMKPTVIFRIYEKIYNGERYVEYSGARLRILRTYPLQGERLEIVATDDLQDGTE